MHCLRSSISSVRSGRNSPSSNLIPERHSTFFSYFSWRKIDEVVKTPSDRVSRNLGRSGESPSSDESIRIDKVGAILQLARSVILVISKGFVDFNSRGMSERLVWSTELGRGAIDGWVRVVRRVCTEADQASSSFSARVPNDWEKEDLVLDLTRWDLHNDEDGFHDRRGGQDM